MSEEPLRKAEEDLRKAIDDLFRRDWRLRRLLDFTQPYRVQPRWRQRMQSRAAREKDAALYRAIASDPNYEEDPLLSRESWYQLADQIAPRRGHRFTFPETFVRDVDAWSNVLAIGPKFVRGLAVRTHLYSSEGDKRRSPTVDRNVAIERYLVEFYGRAPTKQESVNAQAIYCQRARRIRGV